MNIKELIVSEEFRKKNQFQRREIVSKYLLTEKDCRIGNKVMCFEQETIVQENYKFYFQRYYSKPKEIKSIKIGAEYFILEYKDDKIKIINDLNKLCWYSIDRFLYSLKIERKEKIKKIEKNKT